MNIWQIPNSHHISYSIMTYSGYEVVSVVHPLSVFRAVATVVDGETVKSVNLNGYNEVVFMRNTETIDAFSSHVIPIKVEKAYTGKCINIMTQALQTEDGFLPQGLTSKMHTLGCKKAARM